MKRVQSILIAFFLIFSTCTVIPQKATAAETTFSYTGAVQTYTVPSGVSQINVEIAGSKGADASFGAVGGSGYKYQVSLNVNLNEALSIYVGGIGWPNAGAGRTNGGGASYIMRGSELLAVAGGGGGAGGHYYDSNNIYKASGGNAGWTSGGPGTIHSGSSSDIKSSGGGTQTAGGTAGLLTTSAVQYLANNPSTTTAYNGAAGAKMQGGNGGTGTYGAYTFSYGGGGGGGYYGGGGGAYYHWSYGYEEIGPGGGGSSWAISTATNIIQLGTNSGNGYIKITPIDGSAIGVAAANAAAAASAAIDAKNTVNDLKTQVTSLQNDVTTLLNGINNIKNYSQDASEYARKRPIKGVNGANITEIVYGELSGTLYYDTVNSKWISGAPTAGSSWVKAKPASGYGYTVITGRINIEGINLVVFTDTLTSGDRGIIFNIIAAPTISTVATVTFN